MRNCVCSMLLCAAILLAGVSKAAKTTGNVKVLCVRVLFKDYKNPPSLSTITNRIRGAETQFEKFSFGKMDVTYDTVTVTLPNNRGTYTAGALASAAENKVPGSGNYDIVVFFHGGHASGNKAIVGGSRVWTTNGGSLIHEMGHCFGWGHQSRWTSSNSNPISDGGKLDNDVYQFMKTGTIDPGPARKWGAKWISDRYNFTATADLDRTVRLYAFDQKNMDPANSKRTIRVQRTTGTKKFFWLGFRATQLNNYDSNVKNNHLRQGVVFYWERSNASPVLLDMHPNTGGVNDHSLQPGETYADKVGDVYITNLGRGGTSPNEYVDVQVKRGEFPGNQAPVPTWNAPYSVLKGEPYTFVVTPNDPDGDPVACMWKTASSAIPVNTSSNSITKSWDSTGTKKVSVVVSDMKGKTATLTRNVEVVDAYPVSQWTGEGEDAVWNTTSNWLSGAEPSTKLDIVSFNGLFSGVNQPLIDGAGVVQRLVKQVRLDPVLNRDVAITLSDTNSLLRIYGGGIDMSSTTRSLDVVGDGEVRLNAFQSWTVATGAALTVAAELNMNNKGLRIDGNGTVVLSGGITGGGALVKGGQGVLELGGSLVEAESIVVDEGSLSLGNSSIKSCSLPGDLRVDGTLRIDADPAATVNCDHFNVAGELAGTGRLHVSVQGGGSFTNGQLFQVFNKAFPNGNLLAIEPTVPAPGFVWANRLAIDGTIAAVSAPPAGTFDAWTKVVSGVLDPSAKFEADPNGDGIKNGMAYFLGASLAMNDSTGLLPQWNYNPGTNAAFSVTYRRLDEATNQIYSAIEYTTNLTDWILAVDGQDGIVETIDDDFFGAGIDRVTVCLCDGLAPGGELFGRLVVLDRMSPAVVLPHYGAWAAGLGLTGPDADPTRDVDGDGDTNVKEFLSGADPRNPFNNGAQFTRGTVSHVSGLAGGFYGILGDDGIRYDPHSSLPPELRVDGIRVMFQARRPLGAVCIHAWGAIVEILEVQEL